MFDNAKEKMFSDFLKVIFVLLICISFLFIKLKIIPKDKLDITCDKYKINPIKILLNIKEPMVPIIKIGPDVVQNTDILFASDSEIRF